MRTNIVIYYCVSYALLQYVELSTRSPKLHRVVRAEPYEIDAVLCGYIRGVRLPVSEARYAKVSIPISEDFTIDTIRTISIGSDDHPSVLHSRIRFVVKRYLHVRVPYCIRDHCLHVHNRMRYKWIIQR